MIIKAVIVDDELRAVNRLNALLSKIDFVNVIAQFTDPHECYEKLVQLKPNVLFLDIEMPGLNGINLIKMINSNNLNIKTVVTSGYSQYAIDAIRQEAFDFIEKPIKLQVLEDCLNRFQQKVGFQLTEREQQIVYWISKGLNSREIGEKLFISKHTVDTHRRKLLEKTGCPNTAALVNTYNW